MADLKRQRAFWRVVTVLFAASALSSAVLAGCALFTPAPKLDTAKLEASVVDLQSGLERAATADEKIERLRAAIEENKAELAKVSAAEAARSAGSGLLPAGTAANGLITLANTIAMLLGNQKRKTIEENLAWLEGELKTALVARGAPAGGSPA